MAAVVAASQWEMPNQVIVALVLVAALVAVPWLGAHGIVVLVRGRRRRDRVLEALAEVAAAATIAAYAFGTLGLLTDESDPRAACQSLVSLAPSGDIVGSEASFVPLHFTCRVDGVGTYDHVPGYVNAAVLIAALTAVLLVTLAWWAKRVTLRLPTTGNTSS